MVTGSPRASSGHRSPGSPTFLWDAHPLLSLPRKVTLLVVGLDNAGKTSVIMDLERGEEQHGPGAGVGWRQQPYSLLQPSGLEGPSPLKYSCWAGGSVRGLCRALGSPGSGDVAG